MKENFVTYEQAKLLKESGFNWECNHMVSSPYDSNRVCFAPTLSQAQKWVREVKGVIICIEPRFYKNKRPLVGYDYHLFNKDDGMFSHIESETIYDTYEEALSEAIDKVIEILKQENKI